MKIGGTKVKNAGLALAATVVLAGLMVAGSALFLFAGSDGRTPQNVLRRWGGQSQRRRWVLSSRDAV